MCPIRNSVKHLELERLASVMVMNPEQYKQHFLVTITYIWAQ